MSLPPDWLARKTVTSADLQSVESSGGGKHCPTHTHTPANLRLRGSVVVAVVVLLQLRANTHTLKHRRADSSRPLERQDQPCVCVHFSKGRCGFVTCRRNNPKSQPGNRKDYFYGDTLN